MYNKLVDVKERVYTTDELGDSQRSGLTLVKQIWASVKPMSGSRVVQYDQVERENMIEIKTHFPKTWTMNKSYVLIHDSQEYQVTDFYGDERQKELTIEAKRYE
jgi:SPP1 family predicted phage head-tail adaptor